VDDNLSTFAPECFVDMNSLRRLVNSLRLQLCADLLGYDELPTGAGQF
jgi:hypothetical protein